jgi:hypothetical protein
MAKEPDARLSGGEFLEDVPGTIAGAVVDDDQFPLKVLRERSIQDGLQAAGDNRPFVIDRDQDAEEQQISIEERDGVVRDFRRLAGGSGRSSK